MINNDWKKQAAQVLDEKEVERAFMDQAYNFVANKAGPLMEDAHRLGFEVVYSDEDHTRMVGIFAFRINKELLYVPVFFLNGQIRGTDLLYTHDTKMFRPLNKDWATFLVEKQKDSMGEGIDTRNTRRDMPKDIELEDIAYPPASYAAKSAYEMFEKLAGEFDESMDSEVKTLVKKYIDKKHSTDNEKPEDADCGCVDDKREVEKETPEEDEIDTANVKKASALRDFIIEDGGLEAVEKIASWMQDNKRFAELLVTHVDADDYMPNDLLEMAKAASVPGPDLVLYTGGLEAFQKHPIGDTEKAASAQDEFFEKGYYLWDDRAPGDLNPTTKDLDIELCKPGEPGLYKILMTDGSLQEACVAAPSKQNFSPNGEDSIFSSHPDAWSCNQWDKDQPRELCIIMKDGGECGKKRRLHAEFVKTLADCIRDEELDTEMKAGKCYCVYDAESGTMSDPIHCISKRTEDDLEIYKISNDGWSNEAFEIRQNKDNDNSSFDANYLGKHTFFLPVTPKNAVESRHDSHYKDTRYSFRAKDLPAIGDEKTLTQWVLQHGIKEASIVRDPRDSAKFSLRAGPKKQTHYMPRFELAAKMARDLGIHADEVEFFMDKAASDGQVKFLIGEPGMDKYAAPIQITEEERWKEDYDSDFGHALDYPQTFALDTQTRQPIPPERRIGDGYDPGMGMTAEDGQSLSSEALQHAPMEQLEQMKEQAGVPNVFEHGLVGSLIHTYDSVAMIDKYVPDLEKALDRLGRLLFLYYWKPRDFEDAYGADDMANMENQLLSTFQSFGELVLELLKKSETNKGSQGNVSMYSA